MARAHARLILRSFVTARVEGMDGGEKKQSQVVTGSKPTFNQTLQFVVTPSARANGDGGDLVLCVWDRYLFKECRVRASSYQGLTAAGFYIGRSSQQCNALVGHM